MSSISSGSPWRTLTYAMSQASSGDTVHVAAGTYDSESFPIPLVDGVTIDGEPGTIVDQSVPLRKAVEGLFPAYLSEEELNDVLPVMARMVKYLYLSVPTDYELERQVSDLEFKDEYAIRRSKEFYRQILAPHFTLIGNRILESKVHFNEDNTFFTDYLFRD